MANIQKRTKKFTSELSEYIRSPVYGLVKELYLANYIKTIVSCDKFLAGVKINKNGGEMNKSSIKRLMDLWKKYQDDKEDKKIKKVITGREIMEWANDSKNGEYDLSKADSAPQFIDISIYMYTHGIKSGSFRFYLTYNMEIINQNAERVWDDDLAMYITIGEPITQKKIDEYFYKDIPGTNAQYKKYWQDGKNPNNANLMYDWYYGSGDAKIRRDDKIIITTGEELKPEKVQQFFLDGIEHCFLQPIINWAEIKLDGAKSNTTKKTYKTMISKISNKWYHIFKNGADELLIGDFCNDININVSISFPLGYNNLKLLNYKSNRSSIKEFKYINTRMNHLECVSLLDNAMYKKLDCSSITCFIDRVTDIKQIMNQYKQVYNIVSNINELSLRFPDYKDKKIIALNHTYKEFLKKDDHLNVSYIKPIIASFSSVINNMKKITKDSEMVIEPSSIVNDQIIKLNDACEMKHILFNLNESKLFNQYIKKQNDDIMMIKTASNIYKLESEADNIISEFEMKNNMSSYTYDYIKNKKLCDFIKSGIHFNTSYQAHNTQKRCKPFFESKKNNEINILCNFDQEKAYSQFAVCPEYIGFLGKITDFRKCTSVDFALANIGMYQINNIIFKTGSIFKKINNAMKIFINMVTYTTPELIFLYKHASFDIVCGCWGSKFDFSFGTVEDRENGSGMFTKYSGVPLYSKFAGKCAMHETHTNFIMPGEPSLFENLKFHNPEINVTYFDADKSAYVSYPKNKINFKGHITAFITAYARLNLIHQLMKMNFKNVLRVVGDGIYYYTEIKTINFDEAFEKYEETGEVVALIDKYDFELLPTFRNKEFKSGLEFGLSPDTFISNPEICDFECSEFLDHNMKMLYFGAGGTGKTHMNLIDEGFNRLLYVSPSWKLSSAKKIEYKIDTTVLARCIIESEESRFMQKNYDVIVFDECSQYTEKDKQLIFKFWPNHKLIFCGDIGYQLPPPSNEYVMNINGFDYMREFSTVYRFKCDKLAAICATLRKQINFINHEKSSVLRAMYSSKITEFIISKCQDNIIKFDDVDKLYKLNDYILVSKNKCNKHHLFECNCDCKNFAFEYNNLGKGDFLLDKFICKKNTRTHNNGDIVMQKVPMSIRAHAFSIHSIQGETAEHKLFIDLRKMFEPQMLYTAISRARTLEQIYFIN